MPAKRKGFFAQDVRPADEDARRREVEALLAPRRTVVQDLPADRIGPNPFQARKSFTGLEELAEAIRAQGFTSRLRVRPDPGDPTRFQLVYGERRLRAARLAGLERIPAEIADHSDEDLIEIGLAENIQRRDLDPLEEAEAFRALIDTRGYSVRRLAERIGKDKSYVEDRLALLRAPEDVREMIAERPDALRAAREIAKVESPDARAPLISGVVGGQLSTQDVRAAVREIAERPERMPSPSITVERDLRSLRAVFARWGALAHQGPAEQAAVREALTQVLLDAQALVAALETE